MARGGGSLLFPLVLAFIIGILLYFYWGVSSQLRGLREGDRDLRRELSNARNERDNLQYRYNLLKEDLNVASDGKQEALQRAEEQERNFLESEQKLVRGGAKWEGLVQCPCGCGCGR